MYFQLLIKHFIMANDFYYLLKLFKNMVNSSYLKNKSPFLFWYYFKNHHKI